MRCLAQAWTSGRDCACACDIYKQLPLMCWSLSLPSAGALSLDLFTLVALLACSMLLIPAYYYEAQPPVYCQKRISNKDFVACSKHLTAHSMCRCLFKQQPMITTLLCAAGAGPRHHRSHRLHNGAASPAPHRPPTCAKDQNLERRPKNVTLRNNPV